MRYFRPKLRLLAFAAGLGALVLFFAGFTGEASAQNQDAVEKVREALRLDVFPTPLSNAGRRKNLDKAIENLHTPSELRRSLELSEWTDAENFRDPDAKEQSAVDRAARKKIGDRLKELLAQAVDRGDATGQLAAATFVAEIGSSIRALTSDFDFFEMTVFRDPYGYGRSLAPLMVALTEKKGEHAVRQQAARALGKINSDPKLAVPALQNLLQSKNAGDRKAAAEALVGMVTNISQLYKAGRVQTSVVVKHDQVADVATQVVPAAASHAALPEPDPLVRRQCLIALGQCAVSMDDLLLDPREVNRLLTKPAKERSEIENRTIRDFEVVARDSNRLFPPLIAAMQKQGKVLASALEDPDEENRIQARRALEWIARLRLALLRLPRTDKVGDKSHDPLLDALEPSLRVFSRRLADPDVNVRRASLDFLEQMESAIGPAIPAVQTALGDPDRFIRWAAARSLREIGEKNIEASAAKTVPALARLLGPDEDPDVRESAATTLRRYGALSRPALPALIAAVEFGELEQREALIKAIQQIAGPKDWPRTIPALRQALSSRSVNARKAAAEALGSMGPAAAPAADDLRARLQDDDPTVRAAASDALLLITRPKGQ